MRSKLFYAILVAGVILDGFLLSKPNLLGKIGLFIYKFHYLRTVPRAILTVSMVMGTAVLVSVVTKLLVNKEVIGRNAGKAILLVLVACSVAMLIETILTFLGWSAGHTGLRFKLGAYLLPSLMLSVFVYFFVNLLKTKKASDG